MDNIPIQYTGHLQADHSRHDGGLPLAAGVHSFQVLRANRERPEMAEGIGWTYNHAPMLAYWNERFYLSYLSSPVYENGMPTHTLIVSSQDGRHWEKPEVSFPAYPLPDSEDYAVAHQRMGFYVTRDGERLLALAFYGLSHDAKAFDMPNDGRGIGRVVREVYRDGSMGPIFFIRYNIHAGWGESNTSYALYDKSEDSGFIAACEELLADKLMTLQWWEEDRSTDGFYEVTGQKAFSWYTRDDGMTVGLWKWSKAALSADQGQSWTEVADIPTFTMAGAKVWGARTSDGCYAIIYNPVADNGRRWPLAAAIGTDGIHFDRLLLVNGEVPPRRYSGFCKDYGLQYVRGIEEGNGVPPDRNLWITYSMNKEDIWVSRIPIPIHASEAGPVHDTFEQDRTGMPPSQWNVYEPAWTKVRVQQPGQGTKRVLELRDADPYDYAKAERVLPALSYGSVSFTLSAMQSNRGWLEVDLTDAAGNRPFRLMLNQHGTLSVYRNREWKSVAVYNEEVEYRLEWIFNLEQRTASLLVNHVPVVEQLEPAEPAGLIQRICFRTGPFREHPTPSSSTAEHMPDVPHAGIPTAENVYLVSTLIAVQLSG
ncbi:hypothetical protein ACFO9Q_18075 [Paenibacillus sp. GCM10023252]|uniref:hypothetical protein n=1 Tax=Paenibacillus sp. GCM10023252 TaxID=3252649 RepID=UPI0036150C9F